MTTKKKIQINIDSELAKKAEDIFQEIGLNQTSALTAFYKKVVAEGGIPFELKISPRQKAIEDLKRLTNIAPTEHLDSKKLAEWFDDEELDY